MSGAVRGSTPRGSVVVATAMWGFFAVGMVASLVLRAVAHVRLFDMFGITFAVYATVGWLIAIRRPRTPIAWVFLGIGVLTALGVVTDAIVSVALHRGWSLHGIVVFAGWVQLWFWYPLLLLSTVHTLLLFPDGLPSRRWRWLLRIVSVTLVVMVATAAMAPRIDLGTHHVPNPIGLSIDADDVEKTPVFAVAGFVIVVSLVLAVVSLGMRFRRSRGVQRAQLKWFFLGAAFLGAFVLASLADPQFNHSTANAVIAPLVLTAMPVSCGVAILRYRLYDIDRLVSRTVSYFVVTGAVVGVYVGVVALIEAVTGFSSSVAVAASTLAAAAAFQPLRRRVQRVVDRRFDRAAYDARRTVEAFSNRLRDEVDADAVRAELLSTVSSAVAPAFASLWVVTA